MECVNGWILGQAIGATLCGVFLAVVLVGQWRDDKRLERERQEKGKRRGA